MYSRFQSGKLYLTLNNGKIRHCLWFHKKIQENREAKYIFLPVPCLQERGWFQLLLTFMTFQAINVIQSSFDLNFFSLINFGFASETTRSLVFIFWKFCRNWIFATCRICPCHIRILPTKIPVNITIFAKYISSRVLMNGSNIQCQITAETWETAFVKSEFPIASWYHVFMNPESTKPEFFYETCHFLWSVLLTWIFIEIPTVTKVNTYLNTNCYFLACSWHQKTKPPIHEFEVLHNGQRAF